MHVGDEVCGWTGVWAGGERGESETAADLHHKETEREVARGLAVANEGVVLDEECGDEEAHQDEGFDQPEAAVCGGADAALAHREEREGGEEEAEREREAIHGEVARASAGAADDPAARVRGRAAEALVPPILTGGDGMVDGCILHLLDEVGLDRLVR